jgi:hypothetical protein
MPTIQAHKLSGDFNTALYQFLKTDGVEGFHNFVYLDSVNMPTIGVGYALIIKAKDKNNNDIFRIRTGWEKDFTDSSINLTPQQIKDLGDLLHIWRDLNQNGETDEGELFTLDELGITSLNLKYTNSAFQDEFGNDFRQIGSYTDVNGNVREMVDVWFQTNPILSRPVDTVEIPDDIALLPNALGFGNVRSLHETMALDETGRLQALDSGLDNPYAFADGLRKMPDESGQLAMWVYLLSFVRPKESKQRKGRPAAAPATPEALPHVRGGHAAKLALRAQTARPAFSAPFHGSAAASAKGKNHTPQVNAVYQRYTGDATAKKRRHRCTCHVIR